MVNYECNDGRDNCILRTIIDDNAIEELLLKPSKHKIGKGTLEDVCDCETTCVYRDVAAKKFTRRQLEQMRCIYDYAIENNYDMDTAGMNWVSNGYATEFAKVYESKKNRKDIIRHEDLLRESRNL